MSNTLQWDRSLKSVFKDCEVWWHSNMVKRDKLGTEFTKLREELDAPGRFMGGGGVPCI